MTGDSDVVTWSSQVNEFISISSGSDARDSDKNAHRHLKKEKS